MTESANIEPKKDEPYEKPGVAWEQEIDVKRLSVGCIQKEFMTGCFSGIAS